MNENEIREKSIAYVNSININLPDLMTWSYVVILVGRAYQEGFNAGYGNFQDDHTGDK